ncbi:carbohydrate esterase family 4 protein [Lophiostoma macrostomum CBS 122681]|uniref:Carbohydrate esterase family 4 protein n=1 Tax=Lophiostoma macrostomum CBS 122681 TaxID=1314788 RepID=A0A6A6SW75_9PLEO|nr:carbohydrate esterase family 4 protein [Lophiostoma macrostomum CBS 122681]
MYRSLLFSIVSLLEFGGLAVAHGLGDGLPIPHVFGRRTMIRHAPQPMIEDVPGYSSSQIQRRDWSTPDTDATDQNHLKCGPGVGYCAPGDCCSPVGYCGRGYEHCESPNCQIDYSDGCDASVKPLGASTFNVSRPHIGNVTYNGTGISNCQNPGAVALTFDDGPFNYTSHVLDVLQAYGAKATFFITGNNLGKGQIDIEENGWPDLIRRMHAEGHQIGLHSWSHQNLSSLNDTMLSQQVEYVEMAVRNILGFIPTYFRPPYDDCQASCQAFMNKMGYHITYQNIVNNDWQNDDGDEIGNTKELFVNSMEKTTPSAVDYIFLLHDTHYQTSWNLTDYMLDYFQFFNFSKSVTVGECMGDPPENWYRTAGGAPNHSLLLKNPTSQGNSVQYSSTLMSSTLLLICAQVISVLIL